MMLPTMHLKQTLKTFDEPSDSRYKMFNDGGVEVEVGEFLYSLVRMIKPTVILETGTHHGISAAYMGMALRDNATSGLLTTLEFLPENYKIANDLFALLELKGGYVNSILVDAADYRTSTQLDLVFLDTEPQTRFAELLKFYDNVKPGGFILIHDLHPHLHQIPNEEHGFAWPYGKLPSEIINLVKQDLLRVVHFRTPRGLTMFYKPGDEDYDFTTAGQ